MALILKNITKSFANKTVLEDFSYSFSDTGIYALVGESGVGKTTLLRIICGLDKSYTGHVIGGGVEATSVVFQEYRLFPFLTALENVVIPNGDMKDNALVNKAKNTLKYLSFTEEELLKHPDELSGGMKQRVAICRALLRDKPILIMDEPTKELDEKNRESIYSLIKEEGKKRLVILVTHNISELFLLDATKIEIENLSI